LGVVQTVWRKSYEQIDDRARSNPSQAQALGFQQGVILIGHHLGRTSFTAALASISIYSLVIVLQGHYGRRPRWNPRPPVCHLVCSQDIRTPDEVEAVCQNANRLLSELKGRGKHNHMA